MRQRHRFYRHLFLLSVGVMVLIALPYPIRRLSVVCSGLLILLLTLALGEPLQPGQHKRRWPDSLYRLIGLAAFGFQVVWLLSPFSGQWSSGVPVMGLLTLFVFWSLRRLLICLGRETVISGQVIMGAVAGYLLLGITGGLLFSVLETVAPGSFINAARDHQSLAIAVLPQHPDQLATWTFDLSRIYYFAFVSLTTVGFGDIVPATPPAQMASVALSISGPIYLAVVMGLLISRNTVQPENHQEERHKRCRD
ncbi:MAG: two pore domain potassium channel family protein [Synechococcaceae bacterium WB9_2_170]|jgi:hypothetical protein|nr:two pore domain potassium channel family protein [Synechococcaceae bacterium WB9_2_170]